MTTYVPFQPHDSTGNHRFQPSFMGEKSPKRNLIVWQAPHLGNDRYIEMYINPQAISFSNKKTITQKRTKGGFIIQYWGEELETLNIAGETGDGGIEALYPLIDVYRSEQLAFEALASSASSNNPNLFKQRQPLAPLAMLTVMWYMGEGRRGYFTDFQHDETVAKNGSIGYRIGFVVLEQIGRRKNFMPWHRKPWSTTDNPVVSSNGRLVVTGGYPGEATKRIGPLNSTAGRVDYVTTTKKDADGFQQTTFKEQWVDNILLDPKLIKDDGDEASLNRILKERAAAIDDPANEIAQQKYLDQMFELEEKQNAELAAIDQAFVKEDSTKASTEDKKADSAIKDGTVVATPVDTSTPSVGGSPDRIAPSNSPSSGTAVTPPSSTPTTKTKTVETPTQKTIQEQQINQKATEAQAAKNAPEPIIPPPPPPVSPKPAGSTGSGYKFGENARRHREQQANTNRFFDNN
jgi:hypothetical protein